MLVWQMAREQMAGNGEPGFPQMSPLSDADLRFVLTTAEQIARKAGAILAEAYDQPRQITYKGVVDPVTQADHAAEAAILDSLNQHFPDHAILAEESGSHPGENALQWLVDPLDGTVNFAHGFPVFAVSLALWHGDTPLVGAIYDPLRDECFTAARGQGASLNGRPIQVTNESVLRHALLATGFPYDRHTAEHNNIEAVAVFIRRAQGIRRAGAAALDLAYVACGRLDGFWERGLQAWDMGAGVLLIEEAGGRVTNYKGDPDKKTLLADRQIVASNGHIHQQMLDTLKEVYG